MNNCQTQIYSHSKNHNVRQTTRIFVSANHIAFIILDKISALTCCINLICSTLVASADKISWIIYISLLSLSLSADVIERAIIIQCTVYYLKGYTFKYLYTYL
jgi:hypothetical protein